MTYKPSLIKDIFDFRIFRYWLISLFITVGLLFLLAGLGIFSFSYLIDPTSVVGMDIMPGEINSAWMQALQFMLQMLIGALIAFVVIFISWFSFSLVILAILSLFNESIISIIRDKHYPEVPLIEGFNFWSMMAEQFKIIVTYIGILVFGAIVCLLFILVFSWSSIPLLMLWSFFFYRTLLLIDCGLSIFPHKELARERRFINGDYWPATIVTYGMSLTPVLNLFAPLIAIVWVSHIMLERKQEQLSDTVIDQSLGGIHDE